MRSEGFPHLILVSGPPANRREAPRLSPNALAARGEWEQVIDISVGGACLERDAPLEPGTRLSVVLTDKNAQHSAMIDAEVVWQNGRRVGLRWVDLDEPLRHWLANCCGPEDVQDNAATS